MDSGISRRTAILAGLGLMTALGGAVVISGARMAKPAAISLGQTPSIYGERTLESANESPSISQSFAVNLADIPEGGGKVFVGQQVVVTQPSAGEYAVLHSKCPHDNCDVGDVREGQIICFCHGSRFSMTGGLRKGPARKGLAKREFVIQGDTLYVTDVDPAKYTSSSGCGNCHCGKGLA